MKKIGFDFGTTNSAISFYNKETKGLDNFQMDVSSTDYIPTVVAYKDDEILIGNAAKMRLTKKAFDAYEHFKLRLGKDFNKQIEGKNKTPLEVTTDYIKILLEKYKQAQNIDNIEGIVMTVPETWFREASNRATRDNIESIYNSLGYEDIFRLESEPVAAAGYFCWAYRNEKKSSYTGTVVVIDFGGGTLDVTLCEVGKGEEIKILERCGYGEYNNTNGCAGVAFDEAVVEKLLKDNKINIKKGDAKFTKLCGEFESNKINSTDIITKMMKEYYADPDLVEDEVLFTLDYDDDEIDVFCADLAECYEKVNKKYLIESLQQIKEYFDGLNINAKENQDHFKVLMVGGFSNFYCVEETIRNFFGSRADMEDKRFDASFNLKNRSLAISRGAALIAQNIVKVDHTCTHNIGYIVVSQDENDRWIDKDVKIIEKGRKLTEVHNPIYAEKRVEVKSKSGTLRIFMDDGRADGSGRTTAALDQSISDLFPNLDMPGNTYQIGFSVDKNLIPTVHIRDKKNTEIKTSLNKLLERISIREV